MNHEARRDVTACKILRGPGADYKDGIVRALEAEFVLRGRQRRCPSCKGEGNVRVESRSNPDKPLVFHCRKCQGEGSLYD